MQIYNAISWMALVATISIAASPAHAQITPSADGYLFRYKFVKGMQLNYTLRMNYAVTSGVVPKGMERQSASSSFSMLVTNVEGATATLQNVVGEMTLNGKTQRLKPKDALTTRVDTRGVSLDSKKKSGQSPLSEGQSPLPILFPEKPIRVGATLEGLAPILQALDSMMKSGRTTYKFLGVKTVGARKAAVFSFTGTTTLTESKVTANGSRKGVLTFALDDGHLLDMRVTQTFVSSENANKGALQMNLTMKRQ